MKTFKTKRATPKIGNSSLSSVVPASSDDPRVNMVKITHMQGVKQSKGYQTGDVSYAVELYVRNAKKDIADGLSYAEELVENALGEKLPQMSSLIDSLAQTNR